MISRKDEILILGAGPAGMACAMELDKSGIKSIIIEKDNAVGGMAKTLGFIEDGYCFMTDIGPHRFFSKNKYLYDFIEELLEDKWRIVNRQTRQFIDGKYFDYPVNVMQAFRNIGLYNFFRMGLSYVYSLFLYRLFSKKIINFEDYIIANFGKKLGEFNMLNYTEKIWGISCKNIHPDWAKQRIRGLNLRTTIKNMLLNNNSPKTLVNQFYYPYKGTGLIYETISKKVRKHGSSVNLNSYPVRIKHDYFKIKEVDLDIQGEINTITPSIVVNSIPITELLGILDPKPPKEVIEASKKLRWRSQVYLFITLNKESVTSDNWIYFPDKEIPFGRISEMKNFCQEMSPNNKTSLFVEFFVNEGDRIWNFTEVEVFNLAMEHFHKLNYFSKNEVRNYYVFKKKYVYPIYDLDYLDNLKIIKIYLNQFKNLHYIGRLGRFQYTNQDHSLEMGILTAKNITGNDRYDLENIGTENDYFESGFIRK